VIAGFAGAKKQTSLQNYFQWTTVFVKIVARFFYIHFSNFVRASPALLRRKSASIHPQILIDK